MSCPWSVKAIVFAVLWANCHGVCLGQQNAQVSTSIPAQQHKPQGFFDYALGKVNPSDTDYGASLQSGRDCVVQHSIDDLYFWSNVFTLMLLTGTCAIVLLQWRSADKREVIAAALITELWNGRVSDRTEIERRTAQFNALVQSHNSDVERALVLRSQTQEAVKDGSESLNKNVQKLTFKSPIKSSKADATQFRDPVDPGSKDSGGHTKDPQQEQLLLERRLEALQNSEQNLKHRLNQTTLLLDQERRRNASLKGA